MALKVVALLDVPLKESLGMMQFLVAEGEAFAEPMVIGGPKGPTPLAVVYDGTVQNALASRMFADVLSSNYVLPSLPTTPLVAGWIGYDFMARCRALGLPEPRLPSPTHGRTLGAFWIESPATCHARFEAWLHAVAPRAFKERSSAIADLMAWCDPTHPTTVAARWYRGDKNQREDELIHQMRCFPRIADHKRALRKRLKLIADFYLQTA